MKLQINNSGGWRNVMSFGAEMACRVRFHAPPLVALCDGKVTLRILDESGAVTEHYQPGHGWKPPAWTAR